ncbi:helix-turn-helix domain-containing protein [Speluncibacter jeojiensis]|uniref:Helix-turn-helix domain-containing protein n=1 Tax=Speluncibacter jeojiensis TaxID=2710754 RepID=A0A9X4M187_9ACTN|nr:helix-turn-helix domain-containing protein [Corynebacteriales bacterium D3-21]
MKGDADISIPAALIGDAARSRLLMALADGRALPASRLAAEAGVAASTASEHLAKLRAGGMVVVETQGRHRFYRIGDDRVMRAVEALAAIAPTVPVRSLRQGTRAHALRRSRLCYDHLAGRLGVALMAALLDDGALTGGDGIHHPETATDDRFSAPGHDVDYLLTEHGAVLLGSFGVDVDALRAGRRPLIRYCLDWTEQRHHLAGALGAALADRLFELDWLRRAPTHRAVRLTDAGRSGLAADFGLHFDDDSARTA